MNDLVNVVIIVFPDGSTQFLERQEDMQVNAQIIGDCIIKFNETFPAYHQAGATGTVNTFKMLRDDFKKQPINPLFAEIIK